MKIPALIIFVLFACLWASTAHGDIYCWQDENGVLKFTNYLPPQHAKVCIKDIERPSDNAAAAEAVESDQPEETARQEQEDREEELVEMNQALEAEVDEAEAAAEDLEERLDEANERAEEAADDAASLQHELDVIAAKSSHARVVYIGSGFAPFGYGRSHFYSRHWDRFHRSKLHTKGFRVGARFGKHSLTFDQRRQHFGRDFNKPGFGLHFKGGAFPHSPHRFGIKSSSPHRSRPIHTAPSRSQPIRTAPSIKSRF